MSSFVGYSKLSNNIFNLSDEEIKKYYFETEKQIDNGNGISYFLHIPKTTSEILDINFMGKSVINTVNEYLLSKLNNYSKSSLKMCFKAY